MGLTIQYKLKAPAKNKVAARHFVEQLRSAALDLPFANVGSLLDYEGDACDFKKCDQNDPYKWLLIQASGHLDLSRDGQPYDGNKHTGGIISYDVTPIRLLAFDTDPGEGCESANFGLCQYPKTMATNFGTRPTGLSGWRWRSFCKTQYSSNPDCGGIPNFLRCHLCVIALLDKAKELGLVEKVSDEGHFWEKRDLKALVEEIGSWNTFIAALVGNLKDLTGDEMQSEISKYPDVEHLEAAGQSQLASTNLLQFLKELTR